MVMMMVVVVLPWLDFVRAVGAVNRLEKLLHHLSLPWCQAVDAVLIGMTVQGALTVIRVGPQLFPPLCL